MGRLTAKTIKLNLLRFGFNCYYQVCSRIGSVRPKQIVFVTMRSAKLTDNLRAVHNRMAQDGQYKLRTLCYQYDRSWQSKFGFLVASLRTLRLLAHSEVMVIDDYCFPLDTIRKRPQNQVVQLWHAIGTLKKFGLSLPQPRQNVLKAHQNYDWVLINSAADRSAYVEAFDIAPERVVATGAPMLDQLVAQRPDQHAASKRLLYAPTYRSGKTGQEELLAIIQCFIRATRQLAQPWEVYISIHPYVAWPKVRLPKNVHVFQDATRVKQLLASTDLFVTDYSSLSLSFSYFDRPILLYTPDFERYVRTGGFYVDYYKYLNVPHFNRADQLVTYLNHNLSQYPLAGVQRLRQRTFDHQDGQNTQRVVTFLTTLIKKQPVGCETNEN
ncbi:CDP-glycerol glycerophosphotransferase family protein [Lactiplantibacillus plajomi]|uniref:CDP-glycerol glycerophosphotransferase family protein n=1 Tax=Lactiplantibacillus plajomi TaxID=1457217 RepID=A0ABV6K0K4_9LACO|nr:CDP-glycerol glycerophosphotransferase family protein [Lactiplantibacillus plajomi]